MHNHSLAIGNLRAKELSIDGNDVREDMEEAATIFSKKSRVRHSILDFILNPDGTLAKVAYGHPILVHRKLALDYCTKIWGVITQPANLVIVVADGPLGGNLYQSLKAAAFGTNAVEKKAGLRPIVVLVAPLKDGIGGEAFAYELERYASMPPQRVIEDLKNRAKRGELTEASQKPNRLALDEPKAELRIVSPTAPRVVEDLLSKTRYLFYRSIDEALCKVSKNWIHESLLIPNGSATVPILSLE